MKEENLFTEPAAEYSKGKDFTSLICWQDARNVKLFFYQKVVPLIPLSESNNLINQIKRAGISCTANIAEGYGRFHYQEGIQYYRIARASIYELKDHLISCQDLGFIDNDLFKQGIDLIESSKITLNGYINYVRKLKEKS